MDPDRLARLTEQQRACLRFVFAHLTSKEIAPHLGIAPNSVDQHIKAAMRTLGTSDRRAAARMLAEHEGAGPGSPLTFPTPDVGVLETVAMREDQAAFGAVPPSVPWVPVTDGRPNNAGLLRRLVWIAVIAIGIALSFGALVSAIEALTRLARD